MCQRTLLGLACLTAMLAALTGCAGKIRYPNYYVLNLPSPPTPRSALVPGAAQSRPLLGSVAVREFRAPAFLRAGPIVYRKSAGQLDFYDYHRWAVDPRRAVTSTIIENMQARGIFHSVHLFEGREPSDYLVTGTLDDLEEVDKGREVFVEVRLSAQLTDLRTGEVLWSDTSSESTKLEDHAVPDLVAAMSQTAESVVTRLVSSMQHQLSTASASLDRTQPGQR
ncbi:MAG TPA: ABC-type transport auxiliary lipoprotein family protein [Bryobacteraceae bacterium]|nr:ABC-type transport auxiliary lipoprotein family protein [Bryobacteraceae bacterium]